MTCVDDITAEYREAGALDGLIPIHSVVDERTFLTKAGHLIQVLRVKGVDHECLDHSQLDHIARRFEAALRILPNGFRLYQMMLKRDHASLPAEEPKNATVRQAVRNRIEYLQANATDLYTLEVYFAVEYECGLAN